MDFSRPFGMGGPIPTVDFDEVAGKEHGAQPHCVGSTSGGEVGTLDGEHPGGVLHRTQHCKMSPKSGGHYNLSMENEAILGSICYLILSVQQQQQCAAAMARATSTPTPAPEVLPPLQERSTVPTVGLQGSSLRHLVEGNLSAMDVQLSFPGAQ